MEKIPGVPQTEELFDWQELPNYIAHSIMVQRESTPLWHLVDTIMANGYNQSIACEAVAMSVVDLCEADGETTYWRKWIFN